MRAGKLDRTIIVQRQRLALDGYGAPQDRIIIPEGAEDGTDASAPAWSEITTLRAEIIERKADEKTADYGASTERWTTFRTRYSDVRLSDRIIFEGRALDVKEVIEIGRRKELQIKTLARGPQ